jgi:dihydroorotase
MATASVQPADPNRPYDLLVHGGTVLDPANGLRDQRDVAIADGKIATIERGIRADQAARQIDARGKLVLPGLVDLHAHVYKGIHGADPEVACLQRGTTTVLDGGSAGAAAFPGLRDHVIRPSRARIKAWLNISSIGLIDTRVGELMNLLYVDVESAVKTVEANRDTIIGIKARLSNYVAGSDFRPALRLAREAAEAARVPIMIHIGDTNEPLPVALAMLRPGDVVTHSLTGRRHGVLDDSGRVLDAVREARQTGIFFDAAHGRSHFGFETIRRCLEQGFLVDSLATDISEPSSADPAFHLPQVMSKLLALGADLESLVPLVTTNPARYLGYEGQLGCLRLGAEADLAVLELEEGSFILRDNQGQTVEARQRLRPWCTVKAGEVIEAPPGS